MLREEAVRYLITDATKTYVDATLGGGGHTEEICNRLQGDGRVVCFDADEAAIRFARQRLARFQQRLVFVHSNFRNLKEELQTLKIKQFQGILLDLGVSSFQLDEASRGFTFRSSERIDMRMDARQTLDGWHVVNTYDEQRLADVFWRYGEERNSRRIAKRIVASRPLDTTGALKESIELAVGKQFLTKTLARIFQAIRIEVNGELKSLETVLEDSLELLSPGGRAVVISYHSLEDGIVKKFFRDKALTSIPSKNKYVPDTVVVPRLKVLTKKPVVPTDTEIERNPRARSAKMRVVEQNPSK